MKYVIGWLTLKAGAWDAFATRMAPFIALSRSEPGVLNFEVLRSSDDPDIAVWLESYDSEAAHQAHRDTPEHQALLADLSALATHGRFTHIYPGETRTTEFDL